MAKILIVEDNQGTNKAICEYMKEAGHTLFSAFTGSEALKIFREKELDIIVLDIMLPEMSGIVVLHEIRKISNIPVIMLTALDDEYTQSNSFDEMADDYITKPFSMLILGKRITALLRRSQNKPAVNTVKLGDITVDFSGYTASDENGKIDITPKELEILKVLIDNKGLVLSRNQILDEVWGYDCDVIDRTIDAYGACSCITPRREVTSTRPVCGLAFFMPRKGGLQMADDKKNIPEAAPPAEAPAPAVENAAVPEQPAPEPVLTDAEELMLEHEGQAALFEMGEAVPDSADAVIE